MMYHREYNFPAICTGSSPGAAVALDSGFTKCLLAVVPCGCSFPEDPPKGNNHIGSGTEDLPHSASEQGTNASSEQKGLNIDIYMPLTALHYKI